MNSYFHLRRELRGTKQPLIGQIFNKSHPEPNSGCWIWEDFISKTGGPIGWYNGKQYYVRKVAYWIKHGLAPDRKTFDASCSNNFCVNPDHVTIRSKRPIVDRLLEKCQPEPNTGCWIWLAGMDDSGYGIFQLRKNFSTHAHRVSYELFKGPIPDKFQVDHQCNNRLCINPDHLKAMTLKENVLRGNGHSARNLRKTHCIRGTNSPEKI